MPPDRLECVVDLLQKRDRSNGVNLFLNLRDRHWLKFVGALAQGANGAKN